LRAWVLSERLTSGLDPDLLALLTRAASLAIGASFESSGEVAAGAITPTVRAPGDRYVIRPASARQRQSVLLIGAIERSGPRLHLSLGSVENACPPTNVRCST